MGVVTRNINTQVPGTFLWNRRLHVTGAGDLHIPDLSGSPDPVFLCI